MTIMIVAVFPSFPKAQNAVEQMLHMGLDSAAISIFYGEEAGDRVLEQARYVGQEAHVLSLAEEVSPALGLLLGIGKIELPELGSIVAGGPLATALSSIVAVNSPDPLSDLFRNAGLSAEESQLYKESLRRGFSLVTIHTTRNQSDHIKATLAQAGAIDMQRQLEAWYTEGWFPTRLSDSEHGIAGTESSKIGLVGGTLVGAATGAALDSLGGPIGTVVGSVTGAISGGALGAAGDALSESAVDQEEAGHS